MVLTAFVAGLILELCIIGGCRGHDSHHQGFGYLPKNVRDAAGIKPGDRVEVRATASGAVIIEKSDTGADDYKARAYALAKRRPIRGITTDELMKMLRGVHGRGSSPQDKITLIDTNVILDIAYG